MKIYLSLRQKVYCTFCMSIIAAVLSITAFVRCEPMEFDAVALLASIISIPVAVFAITQAINFLWYENKVKEGINELSRELKKDIRRAENDMRVAVRSYYLLESEIVHHVESFRGHIQGALNALVEDSKSQGHISAKDCIEQLYKYMKIAGKYEHYIDTSRNQEYIKALSLIDDDRLEEICSFIVSCKDIKNLEEDKEKEKEEARKKEEEEKKKKKKEMEVVQPQEEIPNQG